MKGWSLSRGVSRRGLSRVERLGVRVKGLGVEGSRVQGRGKLNRVFERGLQHAGLQNQSPLEISRIRARFKPHHDDACISCCKYYHLVRHRRLKP